MCVPGFPYVMSFYSVSCFFFTSRRVEKSGFSSCPYLLAFLLTRRFFLTGALFFLTRGLFPDSRAFS